MGCGASTTKKAKYAAADKPTRTGDDQSPLEDAGHHSAEALRHTAAATEKPITTLLTTCCTACDDITPLIEAIYEQLGKDPGAAARKEDKSFFSLADGVVQERSPCICAARTAHALLVRLLGGTVGEIVGEEDESSIDITAPPFRAGELVAPEALEALIVELRGKVDALAATLPACDEYAQLCAFIDPIDGTKEFCTGLGEQCSICIGFADRASGHAVAGVVYRPLCPQRSWALGCKVEGLAQSRALQQHAPIEGAAGAFLASNSGASAFLHVLREELGYGMRSQGGAGNKALRVLEEPSGCYIQDRGLSRWDTCAAQAVLEANGGCLVQLQPLLANAGEGAAAGAAALVPYTYKKTPVNTDVLPRGVVRLNKYNAASGVLREEDLAKGAPPRYAASPDELKPYNNVLGLVALRDAAGIEAARAAILRARDRSAPEFD